MVKVIIDHHNFIKLKDTCWSYSGSTYFWPSGQTLMLKVISFCVCLCPCLASRNSMDEVLGCCLSKLLPESLDGKYLAVLYYFFFLFNLLIILAIQWTGLIYFDGSQHLEKFGIPVPRYALVNREIPYQELDYFIEEEDFVEVHGNRFWKPFVEKPVHGELDASTLLLVINIWTVKLDIISYWMLHFLLHNLELAWPKACNTFLKLFTCWNSLLSNLICGFVNSMISWHSKIIIVCLF